MGILERIWDEIRFTWKRDKVRFFFGLSVLAGAMDALVEMMEILF